MPNFINFKDSDGTTRKIQTNDWTTTDDTLKMVFQSDYPDFVAVRNTAVTSIIRSQRARLCSFKVENLNTTTNRFLLLYNRNSSITGGGFSDLVDSFNVPPNQVLIVGTEYFSKNGLLFSNGIVYGWSTTRSSYTAASADIDLTILSALV